MLNAPRLCLLLALASLAFSAAAQFQSPAVDGVINPGEYAHSSGNWLMTWDETYLYVGRSNTSPAILHLDVDPLSSPTAGTNANGSKTSPGGEDLPAATALPSFPLPFRSDARIFVKAGYASLATRDSGGGWSNAGTTADPNDVTMAESGGREMRIRWQALPGLSGRPAAFRWLGSALEEAVGVTSMTDPSPAANAGGTGPQQYFFSVTSTGDPTATDPFALRESTWRVTSGQSTGADTLRAAIESANADAGSARRYVSFEVSQVSITETLPAITATVTIDGHTFDGVGSPRRVEIGGPGTQFFDVSGISTLNVSNAVFRNLEMNSFEVALGITGGSGNLVTGCFFGSAGVSAMNATGIALEGDTNTTIGGATAADRNVFSTNTTGIGLDGTVGTQILGNYIGPYTNGGAMNGNTTGIDDSAGPSTGLVISDNVISHNGSVGIALSGSASVVGNLIGVAPDGVTQMPNGTGILLSGASDTTIGSIADPNTIAFNTAGVDGTSGGGVVIRGNTFYENSTASIDLGGTIEATPVVDEANIEELTIRFSLTPTASTASVRLDLYDSDPATPGVPQPKTLRASQCFDGASFAGVDWNAGSGYGTSDDLTLLATSYSDSGCVTPHTGTSNPSATFSPGMKASATVALTASPTLAVRGQNVTLTATVSSDTPASGTVSFTAGGDPVTDCESVALTAGEAQCTTTFASDDAYPIVATYSGDANYTGATSAPAHITVVAAIFTGPGAFSSSANWAGSVLPGTGDSFAILNACTYDAGSALDYHTMYLGHGTTTGSLVFAAGNPSLRVDHVAAINSSVIDMTAGGTLRLDVSTLPPNVTFTRGTGTLVLAGNQVLPAHEMHNLTITGSVGATLPAIVHGTLTVGAGAFLTNLLGLEMHGPQITNQGSLIVSSLQIAAGATTAVSGNVYVQNTLIVDGTLVPSATSRLEADLLNGNGTAVVTGTDRPGSFGWQYLVDARDLSSLDVKFAGTASQAVDAFAYSNLIIDNAAGAVVAEGNASVSGLLTLAAGVIETDDGPGGNGTLSVTTASPTAIVYGTGWIAGNGLGLQFAAGTNILNFPVGTTTAHLPITLTATLASPEMVRGGIIPLANLTDAAGSGIDYARDSNAYYRFDTPAAAALGVTINFGTHSDAAAAPELFVLRRRQGQWRTTQSEVAGNSITAAFDIIGDVLYLAAGNQLLDKYSVTTAAKQFTGEWFDVTVTAVDKLNVRVPEADAPITMSSNTGNIRFDANRDGIFNDSQKALTEGELTVRATTKVIETVTINATDGSLTGTKTITVALGFAATSLTTSAPATVAGGTPFNVTVTARRADGSVATGYTGTITFSEIFEGTVPPNYTYTPADAGSHTFSFQINRAGQSTITVHEAVASMGMFVHTVVNVTGTTSTVLTASPNPTAAGQFVSFRADVTSTMTGNKGGPVTFRVDGVDVQTVTASTDGVAFYATNKLSFGTHAVTAVFGGTAFYSGSTSNVVTQDVGASPFGAPQLVTATAVSTSSVEITWAPVTGAAAYDVYRAPSPTAANVLIGSSPTTSFLDTGRSANTTYLYRVRARAASGTATALSVMDPATTVIFTDPVLNGTVTMKSAHLTELRTAVNAMRAAANLSAFAFPPLPPDATVNRIHVTELRTALNAARSTLDMPAIVYTDPTITVKSTLVKAIHFTQLRNGTK